MAGHKHNACRADIGGCVSGYISIVDLSLLGHISLIGWVSDTLSQGYTNLQSLVKCLDHRVIVSVLNTVCSQARAV